jgi:hypothetical protein
MKKRGTFFKTKAPAHLTSLSPSGGEGQGEGFSMAGTPSPSSSPPLPLPRGRGELFWRCRTACSRWFQRFAVELGYWTLRRPHGDAEGSAVFRIVQSARVSPLPRRAWERGREPLHRRHCLRAHSKLGRCLRPEHAYQSRELQILPKSPGTPSGPPISSQLSFPFLTLQVRLQERASPLLVLSCR